MKIEIEIPEGYFFDKETMSVIKNPEPEFEYVDLGLPSGTKWATCNVGAKKDTDFGDYLSFESAQIYNCPSREQIDELAKNTTSLWIAKNGVKGRLFIGKNGNYIFMPATGYDCKGMLLQEGQGGYCWSSTHHPSEFTYAYVLYFDSICVDPMDSCLCENGFAVRPVSK